MHVRLLHTGCRLLFTLRSVCCLRSHGRLGYTAAAAKSLGSPVACFVTKKLFHDSLNVKMFANMFRKC